MAGAMVAEPATAGAGGVERVQLGSKAVVGRVAG